MTRPLPLVTLTLAVLLSADVLAQNPVSIQFQTDPVLVQTGTQIVFTVVTVPQVLSMTWQYQGVTLGLWAGGTSVVNPVPQFVGRVTITSTQLQIGNAQLQDAGNYTVSVTPTATTGLAPNSRSIQLGVFVAVSGVTIVIPSVAVEGQIVTLNCTWTAGTTTTVQWGKDGVAITANSRITLSGGALIINPAQRGDAGKYTCTVSNPVSAQTASQTLTVYYGPDTPVLTKQTPKACVGGGDVVVGQAVSLTCTSNSLPPALYSWQYNGQPVTSSQSATGDLTLQTYSTNQSGQYFCTAMNSITGNTSKQGTDLAIVGICLSVGEVVGIVIGSLLLIVIIVLLIVLIVFFSRRGRAPPRERDTVFVQKTTPPDPQPNGAMELGQGPNPPLFHSNTHADQPDRLYTAPPENSGNSQSLSPNRLHNSDTHQHNGRTHTNGLLRNAVQNTNSYPHNGIDNPAFMHTDAHNTHNTLPNTQQQNPNILIQTGTAQSGAQPAAVHVNLSTLPQTAQQNNNAQMPTIHVSLNSYPANGQQTQPDSSFPHTNAANNHTPQTQLNLMNTQQSNPREQSGQSYPSDRRLNGHTDIGYQHQPGHTHHNRNNTSQRNANTQTYQQETHRGRSDRTSGRHDDNPTSSRRRRSWDLLRGTPSYPSGTLQREQLSPEASPYATDYNTTDSNTTDYTASPPIREARMPGRSQPQAWSQTISRSRAPRQQEPSADRRTRSRSVDLLNPNTRSVTQLEAANHTQRNHRTQRESPQRDIRGLLGSQTAPRQEATHSNNPQALPLMSQQASVGRSAVSQGSTTQQGLTSTWGADTRALADPNHLSQAHMAPQHRATTIQTSPQGRGTETQLVIHDSLQPHQGGAASIPQPSPQLNPSNLTQGALKTHTERAQIFQNREQQTRAALLHPGPQAQAVADVKHQPTPPPIISYSQFQAMPKERTQHKSPNRGPQPSRPPANIRPQQQRPNVHHRPAMIPATHHHAQGHAHAHTQGHAHAHTQGHAHAHTQGHTHAHTQGHAHAHAHAPGHGNHANVTHTRQQQAHRGRPR